MTEFNNFTEKANLAMTNAMKTAMSLGHIYIGSEHMLCGLLSVEDSIACVALTKQGLYRDEVIAKIEKIIGRGVPTKLSMNDFTPRSKHILETAYSEAQNMSHSFVGTEHILRALIKDTDCYAVILLRDFGININSLYNECGGLDIKKQKADPIESVYGYNSSVKEKNTLKKYGRDLTKLAKLNKIDPVIGREDEAERIIEILLRRRKNNPCLIGESGVGKTAIVEGLAARLASGQVPDDLQGKSIFMLDLSAMLAGAKYRGDFEDRIKSALDEIIRSENIILFIDEIHSIIGAGAAEGAIDAANILKPILARGELRLIGATTIDEYRKHIEKDPALERRFQPITVEEPSESAAVEILEGLRDKYEAHHKVKISDDAILSAVKLSTRYISDRFLPDKAVDLIDEAASRVRLQVFTAPPHQRALQEKLRRIYEDKAKSIYGQDFETAAKLRDEEQALRAEYNEYKRNRNATNEIYGEVNASDIEELVAKSTGIPIASISESENAKLSSLEERLSSEVIGQEKAVSALTRAVKRGRVGLKNPNRPVGTFIFSGPSGVGKTELCKVLARELFGDEKALIRFDMSEYMEKHTVSKLIGSPPGYVGYGEGGQLTEKIRRKPYSIVLFDEIEKAHPDVFNILLQVMEDGVLTASDGRKTNFKNAVIIMTSNVGAAFITDGKRSLGFSGESEKSSAEKLVLSEINKTFRPEFLNRVDDIIIFEKLTPENIKAICRSLLRELIERSESIGIKLIFAESAINCLSEKGYSDKFGARPLKRTITTEIEDKLSEFIIEKKMSNNSSVMISHNGSEFQFDIQENDEINRKKPKKLGNM